ncbi:hypothetical protein Misp01_41850 [Microtetraspora sp. NBRC 13810]|nr:hypothetical protein Misp01_41850 [Microtetraspora sp. NBRC 13810]
MLATYTIVRQAERRPDVLAGHSLEVALVALSLVLLALVGWSTWWSVGRTLRPIDRIRAEIAEITAYDLSRRMPVDDDNDEIARLAATVNQTLDRLERAVQHERQFASDASHELRTPLTGMRARIEVALADPTDSDPWETLRAALKDSERLSQITNDLLMLSRLDSGLRPREEHVDLALLVQSLLKNLCKRVPVQADISPGVAVQGDTTQLTRLVTNLLANADRHAESRIEISVGSVGGQARLEVRDDGVGIAIADRERVFQRFTRLDSARSRGNGGTGLGLPIARDIAVAHHGRLDIEDPLDGKGARLVLRLPLETAADVAADRAGRTPDPTPPRHPQHRAA